MGTPGILKLKLVKVRPVVWRFGVRILKSYGWWVILAIFKNLNFSVLNLFSPVFLSRATVAINRNMKLESRSKSQGKGKKSKKERQENRKLRKSTKQQDFNELQIEWS